MDNKLGLIRDVYTAGRPNPEGHVIFTDSKPQYDDSKFQKLNDPWNGIDQENTQMQVRAGYWTQLVPAALEPPVLTFPPTS
ncbi:hypothetical protein F4814DRAFT_446456 [Daldinia grandis]|nr:hypothetical protein F4814DRAFT_446456 [Daldinia grandis]